MNLIPRLLLTGFFLSSLLFQDRDLQTSLRSLARLSLTPLSPKQTFNKKYFNFPRSPIKMDARVRNNNPNPSNSNYNSPPNPPNPPGSGGGMNLSNQPPAAVSGQSYSNRPQQKQNVTSKSDLFELIDRLQSARLDDQRCCMPPLLLQGAAPSQAPPLPLLSPQQTLLQK